MMAFITHCWKSTRAELLARFLIAWLAVCLPLSAWDQTSAAEISQIKLERSADGLQLSANINFKLSNVVQEALQKGVTVVFLVEAEVSRDRWYWTDKKIVSVARSMRLSFNPMTRRWRLALGVSDGTPPAASLSLNFDTLEEALATVQQVSNWRIAEWRELDSQSRHQLELRFRLDLGQLPRPMQIGVLGQADWALSASQTQKFVPGEIR